MDWPVFALITYAFALALLLAAVILHSLRENKGRYQRLLEEKEQRLAAMQMDVEETLETLGEQAAALEMALGDAGRRERANSLALQQRLMEMQGAVVAVQARLLRLEQGMEALGGRAGQAAAPPREEPEALDPPAPADPTDGSGPQASPCCQGPGEAEGQWQRRAVALFERGEGVAQVSRLLGCSCVEAAMLQNQWEKGYLREDGLERK